MKLEHNMKKFLEDTGKALQKLATAKADAKVKQKLKAKQSEMSKTKTTKTKTFLTAIFSGDKQMVKEFIENEKKEKGHFDVNTKIDVPSQGKLPPIKLPPILFALMCNHIEVVRLLLEYGANVNCDATIDGYKFSPLGYAVTEGNIELAKIFITHHAKVDFIYREGYTLLIEAVLKNHIDMVNLLIDNSVNIHHLDNSNETALTKATSQGNIEIIKILLDKGAKTAIRKDGKFISLVDFPDDPQKFKEVASIIKKHINDRKKIIEANKHAKKKAAETKISEIEEPKPESENKVAETPKETPVFSPKPIEPPKLPASACADIVDAGETGEAAETAGLMEYDYSGGE